MRVLDFVFNVIMCGGVSNWCQTCVNSVLEYKENKTTRTAQVFVPRTDILSAPGQYKFHTGVSDTYCMRLITIHESMQALAVDMSKAPECCEECGKPGDLRPYGKGGAWICMPCGMKNLKETEAQFAKVLAGESDQVKVVDIE